MAKEGHNRPKKRPVNKRPGRLDGISARGPLQLTEEDQGFNPADLKLPQTGPASSFIEDDDLADDLLDNSLSTDNKDDDQEQRVDPDQAKRALEAEREQNEPQPEEKPGETRGEDPLRREENPQAEANQTPAERQPTEYGQAKTGAGEVGSQGAGAAEQAAGRAVGAGERAAGQVAGKTAQAGEKAVEGAAKAAQGAVQASEEAAGAATRVAALGARIAAWVAEAIAFLIANWEVVLIIAIIVGLLSAVLFGIAAIVNDDANSGRLGGTPTQAARLDDPEVVKAIENLALLAGDAKAKQKTVEEQCQIIIGYLTQIGAGIKSNSTAEQKLGTAVTDAKTIAEKILASTGQDHGADLAKLYKAIDNILNVTYGIKVTEPGQIVANAQNVYSNRANWVGSKNEKPTNSTQPMRDGSNTVGGKQGCDLSGFIVYVIRPNTSDCLICQTARTEDLGRVYGFLFAPQATDSSTTVNDLVSGDVVISKTNEGLGAQVVAEEDGQKNVYYCTKDDGPSKGVAKDFYTGNRAINQVLRLKYSQQAQ